MPKTIYYTALSLDGFLADQYHSLDWLLRQEMDEDGPFNYAEFIADIGAIVMGSSTYTWVVEQQAGTGEGWVYQQPTWVMTSRNLEPMEGSDIRFASGDIRPVHAEASEAAGNRSVWIVGGGDLAGQFADANLLDELIVSIAPVTLGEGAPLLPRRLDLRLIEAARNRNFNCARYEVLGPLP